MRLLLFASFSLLLFGCASNSTVGSNSFYAQESKVARICLAPLEALPIDSRFVVDQKTGRSPMTSGAWCYSNQIGQVARMMQYSHADMVVSFGEYLVRLTTARDRGVIDTKTAFNAYMQTSELFRQSIASADAKQDTEARRELASRISVFAQALSNLAIEQDRQRAANRPVNFFITGVYKTTGVTCL